MKLKYLFSTVMLSILLAGCSSDSPGATPPEKSQENQETTEEATPFKALAFSNSDLKIASSASEFSSQLLQIIANEYDENVFTSPLGVHVVLSMLANGAEGESLQEILNALNLDDLNEVNDYYAKVTSALTDADNQVKFASANSMWLKPPFTPLPDYIKNVKTNFGAEVFAEPLHTDAARLKINSWINDKTSGMIPEFYKTNIKENIIMLLINALYFNGKWHDPFDASKTTNEKFFGQTKVSDIEMMHKKELMECRTSENGVLVRLPYGNFTYYLNVFLPNEQLSPEEYLTKENISSATGALRECTLSLPKFKLACEYENLIEQLKELGITRIFEGGNPLPLISQDLIVSQLIQKTAFELNEAGAKAAAATVAEVEYTSDLPDPKDAIVVNVNRPFIFTITAYHDIVLFAGIVRNL